MNLKNKLLISLVLLALVDTLIPVPIMTLILIYVLFEHPPWFKKYVDEIYSD